MHFLSVFDSFDSEYFLEFVALTVGEEVGFGFDFEEMELALLGFSEVVHEFSEEGELFEGGGEDGILAEVDLVFIEFEAF